MAKQKFLPAIVVFILAILLTGCTPDIVLQNVEQYNETDDFPFPLNNCGNSESLTISQQFTHNRASETYVESASGIRLTASDITELKSEIEKRRGSGSAKGIYQTSNISLPLTAEANSNVVYLLQRIYGWEQGELYDRDSRKIVAKYRTRTGYFSVAVKSREELSCP